MSCGSRFSIDKVNATRLEKYGVTNFFQDKSIQLKAEKRSHFDESNKKKHATSQLHYGVDNLAQSKEVQQKIQQTNLEKYGSKAYNHTKVLKEKSLCPMNMDMNMLYKYQKLNINRNKLKLIIG